jgi:glutaredoxin
MEGSVNAPFLINNNKKRKTYMYTVYSTPTCSWCIRAKDLLKSKNLEYEEIMVGRDITPEEFREKIGNDKPLTVPKIYDNLVYVGGYTELVEHLKGKDDNVSH